MQKATAGLADAKEISTDAAGAAAVLSKSRGSFRKLEELKTGANYCRSTKHSQTLLLCTKGKPLAATAAR